MSPGLLMVFLTAENMLLGISICWLRLDIAFPGFGFNDPARIWSSTVAANFSLISHPFSFATPSNSVFSLLVSTIAIYGFYLVFPNGGSVQLPTNTPQYTEMVEQPPLASILLTSSRSIAVSFPMALSILVLERLGLWHHARSHYLSYLHWDGIYFLRHLRS
jgi:hypothetical protein